VSASRGDDAASEAAGSTDLTASRKWLLTFSVMVVAVMQVLDTSVTNVALPHMQGSLSASVEEVAWVITSYLAANAVIIPATGWLTAYFGRRKFFLVCTVLFTLSSFLSGIAPNLESLVLMRVLQGLGGGPVIPMSQAILWEIFPLHQRGLAMAMWGVGIMMGPIFGPTVGGWIADNWSWRWIFYVNLPIGLLGFLLAGAFLIDSPHLRKPGRIDAGGLLLMVLGFGCLQLTLDWGEREDWFDSRLIVNLSVVAVCALGAFVWRELTVKDPILDFTVFANRNFALGTSFIATAVFTFYSSMLLLALYTQKLLGYDAWSSGAVLAPGGIGNLISLLIAGRLVTRVDQRGLLGLGLVLNGTALY
jgi:DHA2 family multidrug resistance protein